MTGSLVDLTVPIHDDPRPRLTVEISCSEVSSRTPPPVASSLIDSIDDLGPTSS